MNKFKALSLAAVLLAGSALSASASTLDFVAYAANNEGAINNGDVLNFDGTNVKFSSTSGSGEPHPYFDDLDQGRPGGLGVCHRGLDADGECTFSNDDSVSQRETLTLSFFGAKRVDSMSFNDGSHYSLAGSALTLWYGVNGALPLTEISFGDLANATLYDVKSITFAFDNDNGGFGESHRFYVDSMTAVPLPAGGLLLMSALGGVAALRRRKAA